MIFGGSTKLLANPFLNNDIYHHLLQEQNNQLAELCEELVKSTNYLYGQLKAKRWKVKDVEKIEKKINYLKDKIVEVQQNFHQMPLSEENVQVILFCLLDIIETLEEAIQVNFREPLKEIDFLQAASLRSKMPLSPQKIANLVENAQIRLQIIQRKIDFIGYTAIQKLYHISSGLNNRYKITHYTKNAALSIVVGGTIIYLMPQKAFGYLPGGDILADLQKAIDLYIKQPIFGAKVDEKAQQEEFEKKAQEVTSTPLYNKLLEEVIKSEVEKRLEPENKNNRNIREIIEKQVRKELRQENKPREEMIVRGIKAHVDEIVPAKDGVIGTVSKGITTSVTLASLGIVLERINHMLQIPQYYEKTKQLWPISAVSKFVIETKENIKSAVTGTSFHKLGLLKEVVKDIRLQDEIFDKQRDQLKPLFEIVEFYKDPKKYINAGIRLPKAYLLTGPAGCGKSLIARGTAGEVQFDCKEKGIDCNFVYVTPELFNLVGGFKNMIEAAQLSAPCILFFDEFHLLQPKVDGRADVLTDILTGLDEIDLNNDPEKQVIVIAATNRPELLDLALRRSKRFTEIKCTLPTFEQRKHLIQVKVRRSLVVGKVDLDLFAQLTAGYSFADIVKMFEYAELLARKTGITQEHLYEALNVSLRKIKPEFSLTFSEEYRVAVHQAAVALLYNLLPLEHIHFDMVTTKCYMKRPQELYDFEMMGKEKDVKIKKLHKPKYGTIFTWRDDETLLKDDTATQENLCKIQLAGLVAQHLLLGSESYRHKDRQRAFTLAQMIVLNGLSMNDLSQKQQEDVKAQALDLLKRYEEEVKILLQKYKTELLKIIDVLKEKRSLRSDEIKVLL